METNDVTSLQFSVNENEWEEWEEVSPEDQREGDERYEREGLEVIDLTPDAPAKPVIAPKPICLHGTRQTRASPSTAASDVPAANGSDTGRGETTAPSLEGDRAGLLEAIINFKQTTGLRRTDVNTDATAVKDTSTQSVLERVAQEMFKRHELTPSAPHRNPTEGEASGVAETNEWDD